MHWIETLRLRSHRRPERDAAVARFHDLFLPVPESGLANIVLLQDAFLDHDLCIVIHWQGKTLCTDKSSLGLKLAASFSEFGQIVHTIWHYKEEIALEDHLRRTHPDKGDNHKDRSTLE